MTRRPTLHPGLLLRLGLAIVLIVALGVLLQWLRDTAPEAPLEPVARAQPADDPNLVTCERTVPEDPQTQDEVDEVEVLGRATAVEIIECPDAFDGRVVDYLGEVVGDVLDRSDGVWLLVNDDPYALESGPLSGHPGFAGGNTGLAVWVPDPVPDLQPGADDRRGTVIRVRGQVLRADPADGGGLTLRALSGDSVDIVRPSEPVEPAVHRAQAVVALLFAAGALAIAVFSRRAAQRR